MDEQNEVKTDLKTDVVKGATAGMLQINAPKFNCEVIEVGIAGEGNARIAIQGTPENLKALFDYVDEAGKE